MEVLGSFILLDSSFIVAYLVEFDSNHSKVSNIYLDVIKNKKILVPPLCIFEVSVTLSKLGYGIVDIEQSIFKIVKSKDVIVCNLNDLHFVKNLELISNNKKIGTHDFYILQTAMQFDATVYTLDKKFYEHSQKIYDNIILL